MKRILVAALAAFASVAFGATTVPVQLINPTGSTAGQIIVSTGATTAPAWQTIGAGTPLAGIFTTLNATNTTNSTSTTTGAIVSAGGLGVAGDIYSGGSFHGNAFIGAGSINATPIGASTASTGAFTTLNASGLITPSTTSGIKGTSAADSAQAGSVGEFLQASVSTNTNLSASSTPANCTTLPLSAGDWDVGGAVFWASAAGSATWTATAASISTTSLTQNTSSWNLLQQTQATAAIGNQGGALPTQRVNVAAAATLYLVVQSTYSSGTMAYQCNIWARRRR